jgi:guanosine-3',5'-bis(diphosphate) 3'-pyrophosphohydrolase
MPNRIMNAIAFAAEKHRGQFRLDAAKTAYIYHPIAVANLLNIVGIDDPNVIAAALLHDTLEDTNTTKNELRAVFGQVVANLVQELTDDPALDGADRKAEQARKAANLTPNAKLIKLADKICNLMDVIANPPTNWDQAKKDRYFEFAKEVYKSLQGNNARLDAIFELIIK